MTKRITEQQCEALYEKYQTPPHVIAHCKAVSRVALEIGRQLSLHGFHLDLELIKGAGLAHDVARTSEEHWNKGADILQGLGFSDEADIVRVHMQYRFNKLEDFNETDLVCLGDRLVIEGHYAGMDKRFDYIINKAPKDEATRSRLMRIKEENKVLLKEIEGVIGQTIDSLFSEDSR